MQHYTKLHNRLRLSIVRPTIKYRLPRFLAHSVDRRDMCPLLHHWTRCSAIAERPRRRVRHSFGQKWKTGTGRQYFTDIIGLSSTTVI